GLGLGPGLRHRAPEREGHPRPGRRLLRPRSGLLHLLQGSRRGRAEAPRPGARDRLRRAIPVGAVAGRAYAPVEFTIEAAHVAAFARAVGADPADGVPP